MWLRSNPAFRELVQDIRKHKVVILLGVVSGLLLLIVIVLAVLYGLLANAESNRCLSNECVRAAARLRTAMDLSADPCEDFYQYACGRWSEENQNDGWFIGLDTLKLIRKRLLVDIEDFLSSEIDRTKEPAGVSDAKLLYRLCANGGVANDSDLLKIFDKLALPVVPHFFSQSTGNFKFDWMLSSAKIKRILNYDVLLSCSIQFYWPNNTQNMIYCGVSNEYFGGISLPEDATQHNSSESLQTRLQNLLRAANIEPDTVKLNEAAKALHTFISKLNKVFSHPIVGQFYYSTVKECENKINKILRTNNQTEHPQLWQKLLKYLYEDIDANIDFANERIGAVKEEDVSVAVILDVVDNTPDDVIELYMWFQAIRKQSDLRSISVSSSFYEDFQYLGLPKAFRCTAFVADLMDVAVGHGIGDRLFFKNTKPKMEEMMKNIKQSLETKMNLLDWMDKSTKAAALEKLSLMLDFIGFPDWVFDSMALDDYYKIFKVVNTTLLENMINLQTVRAAYNLKKIKKVNERKWVGDVVANTAAYYRLSNSFIIPYSLFLLPIYPSGLEVLHYGTLGVIAGHEITHGFDANGYQNDKFGNSITWFTNETLRNFKEKLECFVKQYDEYTIPEVKMNVNGTQTVAENVADNGGLHHAFYGYQSYVRKHGRERTLPGFGNFSHEQLFFIAFANLLCSNSSMKTLEATIRYDVHSPKKIRILGALHNMDEFADAFKCRKGSKMNPDRDKCDLWW